MKNKIIKIAKDLEQDTITDTEARNLLLDLLAISGSATWTNDKVIDFVNWYLKLHILDFRYTLENRDILDSFKNGDDVSKWHCH